MKCAFQREESGMLAVAQWRHPHLLSCVSSPPELPVVFLFSRSTGKRSERHYVIWHLGACRSIWSPQWCRWVNWFWALWRPIRLEYSEETDQCCKILFCLKAVVVDFLVGQPNLLSSICSSGVAPFSETPDITCPPFYSSTISR